PEAVAGRVRSSGAESVRLSRLFPFLDPADERRLAKAFPGMSVSTSHEVLAEFPAFERSSTTALDAYVQPLVVRYLRGLERAVHGDFYVMKSSGGVVSHRAVLHRPVDMVLSGPAGGIAAAVAIARATGHGNLLTFDMGGTSADFSTIVRGAASWTTEAMIDTFPLALPVVDIESVGAGGGSIAWIDAGRSLRVGPGSAGADPGPIAYGKGGESVTVTDADLLGGVLGPTLLGGRLPLHGDLAAKGIARLADSVHLSSEETVLGVQRVVRATMAKAMRIILARRGLDPRDFALLAFGGAGPMHAWALARELRIPRVLVPLLPGAFSAYGILISPIQLEYSRTIVRPLDRAQSAIGDAVRAFRSRARQALHEEHGDARRAARRVLPDSPPRPDRDRGEFVNPADLEVLQTALSFIPEEMGVALRRTAYSPNIKERMDASCALFDEDGRIVAQAEHIPVHLGSMPVAVEAAMRDFPGTLRERDQIILNDPYRGGTHLPDVTLIRPVFLRQAVIGFAVNRAHHADIGGNVVGSMPATAMRLEDE